MDYITLVDDYISGKINEPLKLKKLYNDITFMELLLLNTRDPKYYNLCSEELKNNISFVIFLSKLFDNDLNLVFSIVNHYVYNVGEYDPKFPRLLYRIDYYIKFREKEFDVTYYMQYRCKIINFFDKYQSMINNVLRNVEEPIRKRNSFGFGLINKYFPGDEVISEFFALHYLHKIIYEYDFEDYIHKVYSSIDELNNKENIDILIDYVGSYDVKLMDFFKKNRHHLEMVEPKLKEIKDNYDSFILNNTKSKVDTFNLKLQEYMEDNDLEMNYLVDAIKIEEIKRLGLDKEFYGKEVESMNFINIDKILDFNLEKIRLYIRLELQNLFKNKVRKLDLSLNKDEDK